MAQSNVMMVISNPLMVVLIANIPAITNVLNVQEVNVFFVQVVIN